MTRSSLTSRTSKASFSRYLLIWLLPTALLVAAFWPRYLSAPAGARFAVHLHAGLAAAWMVLLMLQATLAGRGRLSLHRAIGRVAIVLAPLVLWTAAVVTQDALAGVPGPLQAEDLRTFALSAGGLALFAVAVGLGWRHRRTSALHARFMALSAIGLIGAGVQRVLLFYVPGFGSVRWAGHGDLLALEALCVVVLAVDGGRPWRRSPFLVGFVVLAANHLVFAYASTWSPLRTLAEALAAAPALAPWGGAR